MQHLGAQLAESQGAGARARFAPISEIGASAAARLGDVEALTFFLESARARTLLIALGGREVLRASVVSESLRQKHFLPNDQNPQLRKLIQHTHLPRS